MNFVRICILVTFCFAASACSSVEKTTPTSEQSWGIIISPIDIWAGNTDEEIVIWHNRYLRDGKQFTSEEACEKAAVIYEKDKPSSYNMEVRCISPAPPSANRPIAVISAEELGLNLESLPDVD